MTEIAETSTGPIQGRVKDDVLIFAGVPYAAPPIGNLRFKAPQPVTPWEAVRAATRFSPAAPQIPSGGMTDNAPVNWSEDCLYLNVCTPAIDNHRRPVLVWIHGGAYRTGQGAIPWYNGSSFARNGDIVTVSINYRLGALGFTDLSRFGDEFATSGANGTMDQIAALRWVRENIANFGGDPDKVTIAGESAGAFSVGTLLASPETKGLFRAAIPQSGAAHHTLTAAGGDAVADLFLEEMSATSMSELLSASADDILKAQQKVDVRAARGDIKTGLSGVSPFYPVEGNLAIPRDPLLAIADGEGSNVNVLIGSNKDEATLFIMQDVEEDRVAKDAQRYGGGEAMLEAYQAAYPGASNTDLCVAMSTDHGFRIPCIRLAEAREAKSESRGRTWMYLFSWESRSRLKSTHALEIPFAFNNLDKAGVDVFLGKGPSPQPVADTMHAAWTSFITTGDPGWSPYALDSRTNMVFDDPSAVVDDPDAATRLAWQGLR